VRREVMQISPLFVVIAVVVAGVVTNNVRAGQPPRRRATKG
jgi:hypothetical protein